MCAVMTRTRNSRGCNGRTMLTYSTLDSCYQEHQLENGFEQGYQTYFLPNLLPVMVVREQWPEFDVHE